MKPATEAHNPRSRFRRNNWEQQRFDMQYIFYSTRKPFSSSMTNRIVIFATTMIISASGKLQFRSCNRSECGPLYPSIHLSPSNIVQWRQLLSWCQRGSVLLDGPDETRLASAGKAIPIPPSFYDSPFSWTWYPGWSVLAPAPVYN